MGHIVGGARGENTSCVHNFILQLCMIDLQKKRYEGCWTYTDIARLADEPVTGRPKYDVWGQSMHIFLQ